MTRILFLFLLAFSRPCYTLCQEPKLLATNPGISLRGLSVVNDSTIWASGSKGTVARSVDGGYTWQWITVKGFEKRDFRDIEAFDKNTAVIMAVAEPAILLRTSNAGQNWTVVFTDSTKGMFLDALDFYDNRHGIAVGDPVDGFFYFAVTNDGGKTWKKNPKRFPAIPGEAFFASSGTNIRYSAKGFLLASGGKSARLITPLQSRQVDIVQGAESTGANSLAAWDANNIFIVGGDFANDKDTLKNALYTKDGGANWIRPAIPPHGYRSCVEYLSAKKLVTCGTSGVDISTDGGHTWKGVSTDSFHVCRKSKNGNRLYLAGANGKIALLKGF